MNTDRKAILEKLIEIIRFTDGSLLDRFPDINEETKILEDLGFTSIAMLYMSVSIEEMFSIRLDDVNIWDLHTLGDAISMIQSKLA